MGLATRTLSVAAGAVLGPAAVLAIAVPGIAQDQGATGIDLAPALKIYENGLANRGDYLALRRYGEGACSRALEKDGIRVTVGPSSGLCMYRTPAVGTNVDIAASATLLKKTPPSVRTRTGVGVVMRSGHGGDYRFEVFPNKLRWRLTKSIPQPDESGSRTVLAEGRDTKAIKGTGGRNRIRLRAFSGSIAAWIGDKVVARVDDPEFKVLKGRSAAVAVAGDESVAKAVALFDSITVRIPDPR